MEYKKSLIILSGDRGKGAITIETTAAGSVCRTSVRERSGEQLYLAVKQSDNCFVERLSREVRLPFTPSAEAHYIIVDAASGEAVLYGTQSKKRLWGANMTDGVMKYVAKKQSGDETAQDIAAYEKNELSPPNNEKKIKYDDEAIALNNYYPKGYGQMDKLKSYYRSGRQTRRGFSAVTRSFLQEYNKKLTGREECLYGGFFAMQLKYVLLPGESAFNKRQHFAQRKLTAKSIKNAAVSSVPRSKKKVVPVAADFFDEIRDKIRRLFDAAERMPQIEKYMPDTKWVRVPYEKSGYYAVGLIGSKPDYIAYGLPGKYSANAPEELGSCARWWPFDPEKPDGDGLWILYQDARSGDSVCEAN